MRSSPRRNQYGCSRVSDPAHQESVEELLPEASGRSRTKKWLIGIVLFAATIVSVAIFLNQEETGESVAEVEDLSDVVEDDDAAVVTDPPLLQNAGEGTVIAAEPNTPPVDAGEMPEFMRTIDDEFGTERTVAEQLVLDISRNDFVEEEETEARRDRLRIALEEEFSMEFDASIYDVADSPNPSTRGEELDEAPELYELDASTIISGALQTNINSDIAGSVLGVVTKNVYDSRAGDVLLIPQGSKLVGNYEAEQVGRDRLTVYWSTLVFPNGGEVLLENAIARDSEGTIGIKDQVKRRALSGLGLGALLSVISGVAQHQAQQTQPTAIISGGSATDTLSGIQPIVVEEPRLSIEESVTGQLGEDLADVAQATVQRSLERPPTFKVRTGYEFVVLVERQLLLPEYSQ